MMRTRRVGGFTCGVVLVAFGVMFFMHSFIPILTYQLIFSFWPLILIILGAELLITNTIFCVKDGRDSSQKSYVEFKYDVAAIALIFIMAVFSMCMGFAELCFSAFYK